MLKFNSFGWIVGHEDKGENGTKTVRFDDKQQAMIWLQNDQVHRWIDNECLIVGRK